MTESVRAGRRRVEIPRSDKQLFPSGETKGDLARFYADVAAAMVPHARNRPVAVQRFPEGIDGEGFLQKSVASHYPDWVRKVEVPKREGTVVHALVCDAPTFVYLAGQAAVTPHVWLSRADRIDRPDRMIFDLDPSGGSFADVRRAAREIGDRLREDGLDPFAMTTGSRGIHVTVPLRRTRDFDEVRAYARSIAGEMVARAPRRLTLEARKEKRGRRILIDVMRNAYAQHGVAPYAVRARSRAPVAMPLAWEELEDSRLRPDRWRLSNARGRLEERGDPWRQIRSHAATLP